MNYPTQTALEYAAENGRLPRLGDPVAPWMYRAWMLPYVGMHHEQGLCNDRWGYLCEIIDTSRLPERPIPRIEFGQADSAVLPMLDAAARSVGEDMGGWGDVARLLDWFAYGLGVGPEFSLSEKSSEALYRNFNITPMLASPHDYLGDWLSARTKSGWNPGAFYPTPHQVAECMVQMTMGDAAREASNLGRETRALTVCDPCVGTGRMLLHASNYSLRLYGQDIDRIVLTACKINMALYAPWGCFPISDSVFGSPSPARPPGVVDDYWIGCQGRLLVADYVMKKMKEQT